MNDFFSGLGSMFSGMFGGSGGGASAQMDMTPLFGQLFGSTSGQEWNLYGDPLPEPHPTADWLEVALYDMQQERMSAQGSQAVPDNTYRSGDVKINSRVYGNVGDETDLDNPGGGHPDPIFTPGANDPTDDSFGGLPAKPRYTYRLGHPVQRPASLTEDVKSVYKPALPWAGELPVGGTMVGKTIAEVPMHGKTLYSREHGGPRPGGAHAGWDIPGAVGDPVIARGGGTVLRIDNGRGYGNMVDVQFPDGTIHRFAHLDKIARNLSVGQRIPPGAVVGTLGYTGNAGPNFPHLHLEVFPNSEAYTKAKQLFSSRASWNLRINPREYYSKLITSKASRPQFLSGKVGADIDAAAREVGVDRALLHAVAKIESSGDPSMQTGSYKGLFMLSDKQFAEFGGKGNVFDSKQNALAGARKLKRLAEGFKEDFERDPTPAEVYLMHQQGVGGAYAHMENPKELAWKNMHSTGEGRRRGAAWAKRAIRGNLPSAYRKSYLKMTSEEFMRIWEKRVADRLASE